MTEHINNRRSIGKVMSVEIKQHTSEKTMDQKKIFRREKIKNSDTNKNGKIIYQKLWK